MSVYIRPEESAVLRISSPGARFQMSASSRSRFFVRHGAHRAEDAGRTEPRSGVPMETMKNTIVNANGIQMHLVEAGEGPLVILCHGFPELAYSWRHQMEPLARAGYRVVAPDMRGYGGTDAPEAQDAYTLCHLSADMACLVTALGAERAAIVGHDWGAPVAWTTALLRPDIFGAAGLLSVPYLP